MSTIIAKLHGWRVLYLGDGVIFVAQGFENHPTLGFSSNGIITSEVVSGEFVQGEICQTRSGTLYELCEPIEQGEAADALARHMLLHRAAPQISSEEDILLVYALIDDIVDGKYAPAVPTPQ
jgi:hypothetical protein